MPEWVTTDEAARIKAAEIRASLYPLGSLSAAATRLVSTTDARRRTPMPSRAEWQEEAWDMFDLVGELHFLVTTLANRVGSGALYVGNVNPDDPTAEPEQSENKQAQAVLSAFGGTQAGKSQIIRRLALNLLVSGEGWLFGVDPARLDQALDGTNNVSTLPVSLPADEGARDPAQLEWRALSVSEVDSRAEDEVRVTLEDGTVVTSPPSGVDLIRVWRPHGRRAAEADSAVKASLPVLREIVGLTMRAAAEIDSRLAGAGLLWVRQSVLQSMRTGEDQDALGTADDLMRELIKAMMTPIQDRASAAAVVPMVVPVPDETTEPFGRIEFWTPLDENLAEMRDGAIRRFALGMDAPPETLLGGASMNHWGLWLTAEETVTVHVEPPLAIICDALTTQYLWPALVRAGMPQEQAEKLVVWYSVEHMVVRPNQFDEARYLYESGEIDGATVRRAGGFDDSDAPGAGENMPEVGKYSAEQAAVRAVELAFQMAGRNPALASTPGLPKLARDIAAVLTGDGLEEPEAPNMTPAQPAIDEGGEEPAGVLPTEPTTNEPPSIGNPASG